MADGEGTEGQEGTEGTTPEGTEGEQGQQEPDFKAEAEKWKALSRKHETQAKANAAAAKRLKEVEDADKSESDKLAEKIKAESARAEEAEARATRYEVALEKGVPANLMKFLTGTSREDMEQAADELLEAIKPGTGGTSGSGSGKPKERLRTGVSNDDEPEITDPRKLAESVPRGGYGSANL